MKISIIGSNDIDAMECFFLKHLKDFPDVEVNLISINEWIKQNMTFIERVDRRIRPNQNSLYTRINNYIEQEVQRCKPDILFIFKGMELYPKILKYFKSKGIKLINFNPDHPFIISSRGSGNLNIGATISLYDLHFCYSYSVQDRIQKEFNIPAVYLPFGYEEPESWRFTLPLNEKLSTCFVGTADCLRVNIVKKLLNAGLNVHVYGNGWEKYISPHWHEKLTIKKPVYGVKFWEVASQYRVQLNIFRPHNIGSHNMRSFEMPAAGAIMLAPNSFEHNLFFKANKEAFFYNSENELLDKVQQLLILPTESANDIRISARERSLQSCYSYRYRAETVYENLKYYFQ